MPHLHASRLIPIVSDIFQTVGLDEPSAQAVARSLVENNLVGHDSHGVSRVPGYVAMIERGDVDPKGKPQIAKETATTAILDGGNALGQIVARTAMDHAMAKARLHDVGIVAIRNCGHTGRMGEYTVQAAQQGFLGMAYGSGPSIGGIVAPYLGTSRVFGTNPMSWAIPALTHPAVFFDFATSVVAWGKIDNAIDKGIPIPDGWLLDADGHPTTDPTAVRRGGVMLPFGAHKGYGLSFFVEALTGGLALASCAALPDFARDYPTLMVAVNIAAFQPLEAFGEMVDRLVAVAKSARKAEGVEEILVPGEFEWYGREKRLRDGIDIPPATWEHIVETAQRLGVAMDADE